MTSTMPETASDPPERRDERVAVVGLGAMGLPMASRLAACSRLEVAAYDPSEPALDRARAAGATAARTPAEAATGAGVVVVAVRTLAHVESALFGPAGVARALGAGSVVVLTSTVGAPGARRVARGLEAGGIQLLDAPVSGGPARAASGDLLALLGGSAQAVARARPVIDLLASTVVVVGPDPGDGQAMKAVNQLLCGVHIAAAAEALAGRVPEVLSRLDIFVKDMGIVADAGREAGVALPVASAAEQLYRLGEAAGLAASDDSAISTILGDRRSAVDAARPVGRTA